MTRAPIRTTTALVLSLAIGPGTAFAQETLPPCAPEAQLPCLDPEGVVIETDEALSALLGGADEMPAEDGAAEAPTADGPDAAPADDALDAEDLGVEPPPAQADAAPEPEASPEPAPDAAPAPEAEAAPEPAPEADPAPEPTPEAEAAPDPAAEAEAAPEPAPETAPDPAPEDEAAPEPAPETEAAPEPAPEAATEPAPEAEPAPDAEAAPQAEAETDAEVAPEAEADAEPAGGDDAAPADAGDPSGSTPVTNDAADPVNVDPVTDEAAEPADVDPVTDEPAEPADPEAVTEEAPADPAPADGTDMLDGDDPAPGADTEGDTDAPAPETDAAAEDDATTDIEAETSAETSTPQDGDGVEIEQETTADTSVAAASESAEAEAEVTTEEVTEEDVRRSDEDFETQVLGDSASADDGEDDRGLSAFERSVLLGLGAVAVGSLLDNGGEVVSNTGDRIIVEREGQLQVLRDDGVLLRRPGTQVQTERFDDGSTRTTVTREDGSQVVTIRAADGRALRRVRILPGGGRVLLFDDTAAYDPVEITALPAAPEAAPQVDATSEEALRAALAAEGAVDAGRRFSLSQVRQIEQVRALAPRVDLDRINFATNSAAITPGEAEEAAALGRAIRAVIEEDPDAVFLVEGHTDAVGAAAYNLALSDRRAESLALVLTEYFDVPPENLVIQGYGESDLLVETEEAELANRRATVRNITPLLR